MALKPSKFKSTNHRLKMKQCYNEFKEVMHMKVKFGDQYLELTGNSQTLGNHAPNFKVIDRYLNPKSLEDFNSKWLILSVVPSLDTGVCDQQTRKFNEALNAINDLTVLTISNDLPFAQQRWCASAGLENIITLSDHKDLSFAMAYGTLIKQHRLQSRAVFVLNEAREIIHLEYLDDVSKHPNYDAVIALFK